MNAETPQARELSLPQAFLLLATNDKDGEPELPAYILRTTLAGAILAELELLGAIELHGKDVRATGTAPETELQPELELIREKSRPHTPKRWVSMLEGRREARRMYEVMASRGIVEPVGEKHLGLFRTVRYPEKDHGPEAALLQEIRTALGLKPAGAQPSTAPSSGATPPAAAPPDTKARDTQAPGTQASDTQAPAVSPPDARIMALIALLQAAGLLHKLFPEVDQNRADELVENHWPSRAVEDEMRMIRLTLMDIAT
jgi:hypothetical protein